MERVQKKEKTYLDDLNYKHGFVTEIETDEVPKGLNEEIVNIISDKKKEPSWMREKRLKAYRHWLTMKEPQWACVQYEPIDFQNICYYSAPKKKERKTRLKRFRSRAFKNF